MDQATYTENIYFETLVFLLVLCLTGTLDIFTHLPSLYNLFKLVKKGRHVVTEAHDLHKLCSVKYIKELILL